MKNINKLGLLGLLLITSSSGFIVPNKQVQNKDILKAQTIKRAMNFDGTYEVPLKLNMKMGQDAFSKVGKIEKLADNYYFTFTQVDNSSLANMELVSEGKVGEMVEVEGKTSRYTYTVSEEDLSKPFNFTALVTVMNKQVSFSVNLLLDQVNYVDGTVEDRGERPARFIPEIETNAADTEIEKGSMFLLPEASATVNSKELTVNKEVFYLNNNKEEKIELVDDRFLASNIGKYKVVYSAETDEYKTSLGNNSKATYEFYLKSIVGANVLGKFEDPNKVLPSKTQIQVNALTKGETFDLISNKFKTIADNFQVFEVNLYDETGKEIILSGEVTFYLRADDYFDRTKVKLAHFEDDSLKNIDLQNYGRYIKFNSDKTGLYIAYIDGVKFNMPIWGYVLIGVGSLLVVAGVVTTSIILVKKKKKKQK